MKHVFINNVYVFIFITKLCFFLLLNKVTCLFRLCTLFPQPLVLFPASEEGGKWACEDKYSIKIRVEWTGNCFRFTNNDDIKFYSGTNWSIFFCKANEIDIRPYLYYYSEWNSAIGYDNIILRCRTSKFGQGGVLCLRSVVRNRTGLFYTFFSRRCRARMEVNILGVIHGLRSALLDMFLVWSGKCLLKTNRQ